MQAAAPRARPARPAPPCRARRPRLAVASSPPTPAPPPAGAAMVLRRAALLALLCGPTAASSAAAAVLSAPSAASAAAQPYRPALLHAVLSVDDLDATASLLADAFGMARLRSRPGNVFVGYGPESRGGHFVLELQPRKERPPSDSLPSPELDPFGGLLLAVANPAASVAAALRAGCSAAPGGGRCSGDALGGCAVRTPDGLVVRFARARSASPSSPPFLARLVLRTTDVDASLRFYSAALGLQRVPAAADRRYLADRLAEDGDRAPPVLLGFPPTSSPSSSFASTSQGQPPPPTRLQLVHAPALAPASGLYDKLAVAVPDLDAAFAAAAEAAGAGAVVRAPFAVPGPGTRVALLRDAAASGAVVALVDAAGFERELGGA